MLREFPVLVRFQSNLACVHSNTLITVPYRSEGVAWRLLWDSPAMQPRIIDFHSICYTIQPIQSTACMKHTFSASLSAWIVQASFDTNDLLPIIHFFKITIHNVKGGCHFTGELGGFGEWIARRLAITTKVSFSLWLLQEQTYYSCTIVHAQLFGS